MRLDVPFDLDFTLCCGQVFRWKKIGDWHYGVVGDRVIKIRQRGAELDFEGASEQFVKHYFGLNDDLAEISRCISKDEYVAKALREFKGLRIMRQKPWECLISFVCSSQKSIPLIGRMLDNLSEKFGEQRVFDDQVFYLFPTVERLASASEKELRSCGLGYRAKYLFETSRKIRENNLDLEKLKHLPYLEARKKLDDLPGVGLKVADCVLLFSLEKLEAFPLDVWVKRIILRHYADKFPGFLVEKLQTRKTLPNLDYEKIGDFARSYFGAYAGYAQEYLFHYERTQR